MQSSRSRLLCADIFVVCTECSSGWSTYNQLQQSTEHQLRLRFALIYGEKVEYQASINSKPFAANKVRPRSTYTDVPSLFWIHHRLSFRILSRWRPEQVSFCRLEIALYKPVVKKKKNLVNQMKQIVQHWLITIVTVINYKRNNVDNLTHRYHKFERILVHADGRCVCLDHDESKIWQQNNKENTAASCFVQLLVAIEVDSNTLKTQQSRSTTYRHKNFWIKKTSLFNVATTWRWILTNNLQARRSNSSKDSHLWSSRA